MYLFIPPGTGGGGGGGIFEFGPLIGYIEVRLHLEQKLNSCFIILFIFVRETLTNRKNMC